MLLNQVPPCTLMLIAAPHCSVPYKMQLEFPCLFSWNTPEENHCCHKCCLTADNIDFPAADWSYKRFPASDTTSSIRLQLCFACSLFLPVQVSVPFPQPPVLLVFRCPNRARRESEREITALPPSDQRTNDKFYDLLFPRSVGHAVHSR